MLYDSGLISSKLYDSDVVESRPTVGESMFLSIIDIDIRTVKSLFFSCDTVRSSRWIEKCIGRDGLQISFVVSPTLLVFNSSLKQILYERWL